MDIKPELIRVRSAASRGFADRGWLRSWHSFSFADYYDPAHMGFRGLRVINDDVIDPGQGFPTHPHRDMEIFSYVLQGAIEHKDSMGNGRVLKPGQIQLMSAGKGVMHSEFNPSSTEPLRLLQIWIQPSMKGLTPSYTEWHPHAVHASQSKVLVISPDGREGSARIHSAVDVYRVRLQAGCSAAHELPVGHAAWLQVATGGFLLNQVALSEGDGASTEASGGLTLRSETGGEALLFDFHGS